MWLVLIIIVFCLIMVLRKRSTAKASLIDKTNENSPSSHLVPVLVGMDGEDDEGLIAVITAAVHEFAGTGDFKVVSIKQNGDSWKITGRQDLLRNRI